MKLVMKKLTLIAVLLCLMVGSTKSVQAQIVYEPESLSINGAPKHRYLGLTVDKFLGMYWTCKQGNFFQLDISPAAPRIAGHLDRIVFYNTETSTFNSIEVSNVYTHSDRRAKRNITPIAGALNVIQALHPVSFQWKEKVTTQSLSSTKAESEASALESNRVQLGFIAQDVEKVLTDAVLTDEEGHKLINYNAIIPLLVRSVQELTAQVEEQKELIETLSKGNYLRSTKDRAKLLDCVPNPSNGIIYITYALSDDCGDAYILVSDLSGNKEDEIQGLSCMESKVQADLSTLSKGIHLLTLIVDGSPRDSIQLVLN